VPVILPESVDVTEPLPVVELAAADRVGEELPVFELAAAVREGAEVVVGSEAQNGLAR